MGVYVRKTLWKFEFEIVSYASYQKSRKSESQKNVYHPPLRGQANNIRKTFCEDLFCNSVSISLQQNKKK